MQKNKIIILHDTFLYKGGGERLIMMMGKSLGADIMSGFFSSGSFDLKKEGFTGEMIEVSSEVYKKGFRHIKLKLAFLFNTKNLKNYDTIIFSGDSISAVRNCSKKSKKILYCHTPPRYLYDLKELYLKKIPFLFRPLFLLISYVFKRLYESDIKKMDLVLTNSLNTKKRIKKFLGLDSIVLYPPVDLQEFKYIGQDDYYLSFARLADAKRVDSVVEAFKQMQDKKLLVIYGENDPQKQKIFDLASGYENIEFITLPGNARFNYYVGNSIATIYVPIDEDFGMSPVESMSAGKPVLGVAEGGLKESIIHKKTGFLIPAGARVPDIIDAVKYLSPERSLSMRQDCENRAKGFSLEKFSEELEKLI